MQVIDGSVLEGGGQLLRIATALSALMRIPVVIENIRKNRTFPGLKNQHRTGLELAATIASAQLAGAINSSTRVVFKPDQRDSQRTGRIFTADSVTAGSTMLLLQTALPILLFAQRHDPTDQLHTLETNLTLKGGTNAEQAPQVDYTQNIFIPFLLEHLLVSEEVANENSCASEEMNASVEMMLERRGYYPKGGGVVHVRVKPLPPGKALRPIILRHRGRVISIGGVAHYADLPTSIGTDMVHGALERLKAAKVVTDEVGDARFANDNMVDARFVRIEHRREPKATTTGAGSGIVLWAVLEGGGIIGGSAVGRKGINPKHVGAQAVDELVKSLNNGGCIDEWLQDQIILFIALAQGTSEICCGMQEVSLHSRTAMWVTEQMTGAKFEVQRNEKGLNMIRCHGIGFKSGPSQGLHERV